MPGPVSVGKAYTPSRSRNILRLKVPPSITGVYLNPFSTAIPFRGHITLKYNEIPGIRYCTVRYYCT